MSSHERCGCCRDTKLPSRRFVITALACTAALAVVSPLFAAAAPSAADDERFMRIALAEARRADFPFGAAIVRDGKLLVRGRNLGRTNGDPTAHGEMVAIRRFLAAHGAKALRGATIYTTGEPCAMCMGAILWCGIGRLVFAASAAQLATRIDQIMLTSAQVAAAAKFAPIAITGGVLADEAMALLAK
jgi:tRNA(adenine34) deaminase